MQLLLDFTVTQRNVDMHFATATNGPSPSGTNALGQQKSSWSVMVLPLLFLFNLQCNFSSANGFTEGSLLGSSLENLRSELSSARKGASKNIMNVQRCQYPPLLHPTSETVGCAMQTLARSSKTCSRLRPSVSKTHLFKTFQNSIL